MLQKYTKKAFTLIELSIAMLILGLLISGVLVANKMQKSAKMSRFLKEVDELDQAIIDFTVQYGALPGSMKIYNQINQYPEFGNQSNYNISVIPDHTIEMANQFTRNVYFNHCIMPANGMLQMRRSSKGAYPNIISESVSGSSTDSRSFHKSSTYNNVIFSYGYITMNSAVQGYGATEDLRQLISQNTDDLPSYISRFMNKHVISASSIRNNTLGVNDSLGYSMISTNDAKQISQKYDNGKPYGNRISFGRGRNTRGFSPSKCVTATSWNYGTTKTTIGSATEFSTVKPNTPSDGCSVSFYAKFNDI